MIRSACLIKPWHGKALSSRVKSSEEEHREIQRELSEQVPRGEGEHERQKDAGKAKGHHHKKKSIIRIKMPNPLPRHTHTFHLRRPPVQAFELPNYFGFLLKHKNVFRWYK